MRRRVSGATPTVKDDSVKEVTVRQVPLTLMLSPRRQSLRISEALEMVRVVPPSLAWGLSSVTTMARSGLGAVEGNKRMQTSEYLDNSSEHDSGDLIMLSNSWKLPD